ncbi:nonselective cation channel [Kwoniella heveanensis BCC8398]|uniref:Nonselective cation channel n=1 Tax=Kwoniella heveanensis BCC8398 TaxID=1296120 RepID=A0A1B9GZN1_9TREE|nr:nonselective cation channel [Kwoniella heveanensis BCC8398]
MGDHPSRSSTSGSSSSSSADIPAPPPNNVFRLIHELHTTITEAIDTALSWDQLQSPPINYTLVRPIVQRFSPKRDDAENGSGSAKSRNDVLNAKRMDDGGESGVPRPLAAVNQNQDGPSLGMVLYALMANRIQFITLSAGDLSYEPLQTTRASFCELLAIKILRTFPRLDDEASLVSELVRGYCAFDGAPEEVWASMGDDKEDIEEMTGSALELAIVSTSKHFLSLPLIQHLINLIYTGQLIYSPISARSLITDSYISEATKRRRRPSYSQAQTQAHHGHEHGTIYGKEGEEELAEVYVYNPYEAGWLDHQRLKVPKWRKTMEAGSFVILLALFVSTLSAKDLYHIAVIEVIYIIFSFGFILEEFAASKEHGWAVYAANAWNAFDMTYIAIFLLYFVLRIFGLVSHSPQTSDLAFDILAVAACIIFPRLVFFVVRENVVILALRGMVVSFVQFMIVVILAFSGICFCLWTLGRATWTVKQIVWLMAQIWFGSSYLGFSASASFHPIFGPIVLISYAALCNVLLITMLIAILSNKFAAINQNAHEEHLFQRVVKTVEGVKSDALFSYLPPVNILAFAILVPLSWVCSPRTLHRINVFAIRLTSFPILIGISAYERYNYRAKQRAIQLKGSSLEKVMDVQRPGLLDSWLSGSSEILIASVFESFPLLNSVSTAGPGAGTSGFVTPPAKASTVTHLHGENGDDTQGTGVGDDDDAVIEENENNSKDSKGKAKNAKSKDDQQKAQAQRRALPFDSPLAKIFGRTYSSANIQAEEKEKNKKKKHKTIVDEGGDERVKVKENVGAAGEDVETLKRELEEVRKSQLRMEELLNKVLGGGGGAGGSGGGA